MYKGTCIDNNQVVAVKVVKLDVQYSNLTSLQNEVITMRLCHHPNIIPCYSCFINGTSLWIVCPYMCKGSFLRILQYLKSSSRIREGEGFEVVVFILYNLQEDIVAYIISETAKGLEYLHRSGLIHRYQLFIFITS